MKDSQGIETKAEILLLGHSFCPQASQVRRLLEHLGLPFRYINIHKEEAGRKRVKAINDGMESVPTLVFPDGSTLTEPTEDELVQRLSALGYDVKRISGLDRLRFHLRNPLLRLLGVAIFVLGVLFDSLPALAFGALILGISLAANALRSE